MAETIGIIASILGILAFFAVDPRDLFRNIRGWFVDPVKAIVSKKNKLSLKELFDYFKIEDIRIENIFASKSLKMDSFDSEVIEFFGELSDKLKTLKEKEISEKCKLARENGVTFDNNASFALRRIDVSRPEGVDGKRHNIYKLILEPTDYYSFVFPNLCLDKTYFDEATQERCTLRRYLALDKDRISISTLTEYPECQFKVGTGTVVVTNDNYIICSLRSKKQFIASKQNSKEVMVHLSTAEGMYRSSNVSSSSDCIDNLKPSPFATSARSLTDELNLSTDHFKLNDISCLGYFFDLTRAQPFFLFYIKINLSAREFFGIYSDTSADVHENEAIFAVSKDLVSLSKIFNGVTLADIGAIYPQVYEGFFKSNSSAKVRIASNHAKAGFATFAFKEFGPITEDMLKRL